jgi:hypothetical protein
LYPLDKYVRLSSPKNSWGGATSFCRISFLIHD